MIKNKLLVIIMVIRLYCNNDVNTNDDKKNICIKYNIIDTDIIIMIMMIIGIQIKVNALSN